MTAPTHLRSSTPVDFLTAVLDSRLVGRDQIECALVNAPPFETADDLAAALVEANVLTRFQADRLLAGKPEGLVLGPYDILEPIGKGPVGRVYRARHRTMNRLAAIKFLTPELTHDPDRRAVLESDVRAAARLGHPNVVTVYDLNHVGDRLYLVLEYVEAIGADTLVLRSGPPSVGLACELLRQAALGLHHAHDRGIVHGTLTPGCLLVGRGPRRPEVKISNFGFGSLPAAGPEGAGSTSMPQDYRSPECRAGAPPTSAADLYSLGSILAYLLTGRTPWQAEPPGRNRKQRRANPADPDLQRPDIPPEIANLTRTLLAWDPGDRPGSAGDVAVVLGRYAMVDDSLGGIDVGPRLPVGSAVEYGSALSGLVPHPTERVPDWSFPTGDTAPRAGLADSTLDEPGGTAIEGFDWPPAAAVPPTAGTSPLSGFVLFGLAATITVTTLLVAATILNQFTR
jgi:serine/threonine-protein kinase